MTLRLAIILAAAALPASAALAQAPGDLAASRKAGIVGERYDGYMGFAATPSETVHRRVGAINIRRRALYTDLAARRRVTVQVAGIAVGCELLARVAVGEAYMLSDGVWRRRDPGETVALPAHCPR